MYYAHRTTEPGLQRPEYRDNGVHINGNLILRFRAASPSTDRRSPSPEMDQEMPNPTPTSSAKTGQVNYKSSLQQHAQRSAVSLPVYWTVNHGPPHAPKFKSSVTVDGETFSSANEFNNRKEAEQDVSRVALEGIAENLKTKGVPLLHNDTVFCKSILYEYATKMKIEPPKYTSIESKGLLPMFITSVAFDGSTYTGSEGRTKREAEQIAARAVIESILGSSTGTTMSQIIKSKSRLYDAIHKGNGSCTVHDVGLAGNVENQHAVNVAIAESDVATDKLPDVAIAEPVSSEHPASASVANSSPLEAIKPKEEEVCEESELGARVTSPATLQQSEPTLNAPQSVDESQSIGCSNTRKRQNKGKKSRSKRARADGTPPMFPETTANEGSPACAEAAAKELRELTAVAV